MKYKTTHPTAWFAFGVFAAWAAGFSLSTITSTEPGRWDSEAGLFVGHVASLLMASVVAAPFGAWVNWRQRGRSTLRIPFLLPLVLGMLHPWASIALPMGIAWLLGRHPAAAVATPLSIFGSPLLLGELVVRLSASDCA